MICSCKQSLLLLHCRNPLVADRTPSRGSKVIRVLGWVAGICLAAALGSCRRGRWLGTQWVEYPGTAQTDLYVGYMSVSSAGRYVLSVLCVRHPGCWSAAGTTNDLVKRPPRAELPAFQLPTSSFKPTSITPQASLTRGNPRATHAAGSQSSPSHSFYSPSFGLLGRAV